MAAYTVTTAGNATLTYPIPPESGKPPKSDQRAAATAIQLWQRNLPSGATADRYTQAAKYEGVPYVAIRAIAKWLGSCTFRVLIKGTDPGKTELKTAMKAIKRLKRLGADARTIKKAMSFAESRILKAMATPGAQGNDEEYTPAPDDHPLCQLFRKPNNRDTSQRFAQKWIINNKTTGNVNVWHPLNNAGEPDPALGLWVLPSHRLTYIPMSAYYPMGGWRLISGSWNQIGIPYAGNVPIDARQVLTDREPGMVSDWDGYSPLQAMARYVDILDGCDESRANGFRTGLNPDAIVAIKGATQTQLDGAAADFQNKQGGSRNARKVLFVDGEAVDIDLLSRAVKEMDYVASWEQIVKPLLAALGVPPLVAGMVEQGNYAAFFAALRQFFSSELRPMAHEIGTCLTTFLAQPYFGDNYCVQVDVPTIDDPEMQEKQLATDISADAITVNELRALRNREPLDGGDVPPSEFKAATQAKYAPEPAGGSGDPFGDSMSGDEGFDAPRPDNPASKGSLPNRIKAILKAKDATGHEHKDSGPGGGQFTGSGSGGGGGKKKDNSRVEPVYHYEKTDQVTRQFRGALLQAVKDYRDGATTGDAIERLEESVTGYSEAIIKNYGKAYQAAKKTADGQYGSEAMTSPEWEGVKSAFAGAARDAKRKATDLANLMTDELESSGRDWKTGEDKPEHRDWFMRHEGGSLIEKVEEGLAELSASHAQHQHKIWDALEKFLDTHAGGSSPQSLGNLFKSLAGFDPNQPRDEIGRWSVEPGSLGNRDKEETKRAKLRGQEDREVSKTRDKEDRRWERMRERDDERLAARHEAEHDAAEDEVRTRTTPETFDEEADKAYTAVKARHDRETADYESSQAEADRARDERRAMKHTREEAARAARREWEDAHAAHFYEPDVYPHPGPKPGTTTKAIPIPSTNGVH